MRRRIGFGRTRGGRSSSAVPLRSGHAPGDHEQHRSASIRQRPERDVRWDSQAGLDESTHVLTTARSAAPGGKHCPALDQSPSASREATTLSESMRSSGSRSVDDVEALGHRPVIVNCDPSVDSADGRQPGGGPSGMWCPACGAWSTHGKRQHRGSGLLPVLVRHQKLRAAVRAAASRGDDLRSPGGDDAAARDALPSRWASGRAATGADAACRLESRAGAHPGDDVQWSGTTNDATGIITSYPRASATSRGRSS
jgi:hypothetical protein